MTCESECSDTAATDNNGSDSEEKWDGSQKSKVMTPLKSALRKCREKKGRRVTFSATTVVYSDDVPEGTLEPMKGVEMCLTFEPPPEYQDYEPVTEFRDTDSESDWFPVISVNQQCSGENSSDDDSDDWDVLQCNEDDPCLMLNMDDVNIEDGARELDSESSDSSQDTIILISPENEPNDCNDQNLDNNDVEQYAVVQSPEPLEDNYQSDEQDTEESDAEDKWEEDSDTSDTIIDEDEYDDGGCVSTEPSVLQEEEAVMEDTSKEQDTEVKDEEDEYIYSKTSDIRRTIEQSATRRSLLRGTEVRKRQSLNAQRRNSSSDCLSEKLRWLACPETLWDNEVTVPQDVREWKIETTTRSDELEQFVEQYITRIERIRKRYSLTDLGFVRNPSVRGIKPRFGSTTEILQQLQSQLRPHPLVSNRPHLTWPSHRNSYCGDEMPSCGIKEERGVPEGASSSPVVSSDSLNCESSSEGFIYYSLNV